MSLSGGAESKNGDRLPWAVAHQGITKITRHIPFVVSPSASSGQAQGGRNKSTFEVREGRKTKIGACGIACEVCRNYVRKECSGCEAGTSEAALAFVETLKGIGFSCPVLECAIKNRVGYCLKDCDQFPCEVHSRGFPYSQRFLDVFRT